MAQWLSWQWALRLALAVFLLLVGVRLWVAAWNIPLEAGGVLFTPMLLGGGLLCFWVALGVVFPRMWRHDGPGFWSSFARLFRF